MACLLAALNAEVEEKGEAGEVLLRFEFAGARSTRRSNGWDRRPCRPTSPRAARRRNRDRADYQTMFAAETGRCRGADRGTPFHPLAGRADFGAGRAALSRDAARRRRNVPAGQGRGHARPSDACGSGRDRRGDGRGAERRARERRAHRLRRHDLGPPCSRARRTRAAAFGRSPARPRSSSRRATASARSTPF